MKRVPWVQLAVLGWCAFQARDLASAWSSAPYDRLGWLAFAAWLAPVALRPFAREPRPAETWPSFVALVLGFTAAASGLNTLAYAGLAVACAALMPPGVRWAVWLATAPAWWPAFGWALKALPSAALPWVRLAVAGVGAAIALYRARRPAPAQGVPA